MPVAWHVACSVFLRHCGSLALAALSSLPLREREVRVVSQATTIPLMWSSSAPSRFLPVNCFPVPYYYCTVRRVTACIPYYYCTVCRVTACVPYLLLLSSVSTGVGAVVPVRVLGLLGLIDENQTDW